MVDLSSDALGVNIRRHCAGIAREIGRRWSAAAVTCPGPPLRGYEAVKEVERCAEGVLLDWFLGDFVPADVEPK